MRAKNGKSSFKEYFSLFCVSLGNDFGRKVGYCLFLHVNIVSCLLNCWHSNVLSVLKFDLFLFLLVKPFQDQPRI